MERGRVSGFVEERVARLYCCFRSNFKLQKGLCGWLVPMWSERVFFASQIILKNRFDTVLYIHSNFLLYHGLGRNAKLEATKEAVIPETKMPLPLYF